MTIHQGERNSLSFLPATPLSRSQTLEGHFELTRLHSRQWSEVYAVLTDGKKTQLGFQKRQTTSLALSVKRFVLNGNNT